jgi:ferritin-like metal-binding protein YciE
VTLCSYLVLNDLSDLIMVELENLYDVEVRLAEALPELAKAAGDKQSAATIREQYVAALNNVKILEQVFSLMGLVVHRKSCDAVRHLTFQAGEVIGAAGDSGVKLAALLSIARRVQYYKIAAYKNLRNLLRASGREDCVARLAEAIEAEERFAGGSDSSGAREFAQLPSPRATCA